MKRISIRELQNSPSRALEKAPIEITSYGKTVGYLVTSLPTDEYPKDPRWAQMKEPLITGLANMVMSLKTQQFSPPQVGLEKCPQHGVYKQTCGCK